MSNGVGWLSDSEQSAWRALMLTFQLLDESLDRQLLRVANMPHTYYGILVALSEAPGESEVQGFEQRQGQLRETIELLDGEIGELKQQRKDTPHHVTVNSLPEQDRFTRLKTERKHFIDTIKMIAYRAETSMASLLREHLAHKLYTIGSMENDA